MSKTQIKCAPDGPLIVRGEVELKDSTDNSFGLGGRSQIALCRCGASEDKPFCDGSHRRITFESTVTSRDLPPTS
jgi:CDGSH-type Zn-finger protein